MEEQLILIGVAGAVSSFFISSIKGSISKKGQDHELTDDQLALVIGAVCFASTLALAFVKENFNFQAVIADFVSILGASYVVYRGVMKRRINGKTIDDYIEEN